MAAVINVLVMLFCLVVTETAIADGDSLPCGGEFVSTAASSGTFSSPGYPGPYASDVSCRFLFIGRPKERVQIKFLTFSLHYVHDDVNNPFECEEVDMLVVHFLALSGATSGRYCGNKLPPTIMSPDNKADLEFVSRQGSPGTGGFTAEFKFVTDFGIKVGERDKSKGCTFIIRSTKSTSGAFTSPNYPGLYPRNTECHYLFYGTGLERVHLTFNGYEIDGVTPMCHVNTQSDYVEFSNFNVDLTDRKLQRLCGKGSKFAIQSDGTFFRVTFRSNDVFDGLDSLPPTSSGLTKVASWNTVEDEFARK